MKAADITDEQFLAAMRTALELRPGLWVTRWDVGAALDGRLDYLRQMGEADAKGGRGPDYPEMPDPIIPPQVILAKARKLIRRGVIDGCACGCRGDFEFVGS